MDTRAAAITSIHPLAWIAGISVFIFSVLGIGVLMGWIPNPIGSVKSRTAFEARPPTIAMPAPPVSPAAPVAPAKRLIPAPRASAATLPAPAPVVASAIARARCTECGVIESVREIETEGDGTDPGAAGGPVAGNEVGKRVISTRSFSVIVRLDDGSSRAFSEAILPAWRLGDKVRIVNGEIQSNT